MGFDDSFQLGESRFKKRTEGRFGKMIKARVMPSDLLNKNGGTIELSANND